MRLLKHGDAFVLHCERDEKLIPKLAGFAWWSIVKDQWATESRQNAAILDKFATQEVRDELLNEIARQHYNLEASDSLGSCGGSVEVRHPQGMGYRRFQIPAILGMVENKRTLLADEMGTGKTIEVIGMINQVDPESVLIVCPASLKLNWLQELEKWYTGTLQLSVHDGKTPFTEPRGVHILNYDFLSKWKEPLQAHHWPVVVADECFEYDTPVITDEGVIPIGEIVDNQLHVSVLACDPSTHELSFKQVVKHIAHNKRRMMVRITHEHGQIECTANHRIWTEEHGYQIALDIPNGAHLCVLQDFVQHPNEGESHGEMLLSQMRQLSEGSRPSVPKEDFHITDETTYLEAMRVVWKLIRNLGRFYQRSAQEAILLNEVQRIVANITTRMEIAALESHERPHITNEGSEESGCKRQNASPKQRPCIPQEGHGRECGMAQRTPDIPEPRRQAGHNETTTNTIRPPWGWLADGVRSVCRCITTPHPIPSTVLLARHCPSDIQDRRRGGRKDTHITETEGFGQAPTYRTVTSGVVRVEILEQGYPREPSEDRIADTLYDIEVADHHNYFANGVLVSNSHLLKNKKAQRTRAFMEIQAERMVLASGTPILNRPDELWTSLHYLWPEVFDNWHWFVTTYCAATRGKRGFDTTGCSNPKALSRLLKRMGMIRRLKRDVMPYLPPKERQIIEVPVDDMTMFNLEFEVYNTWLAAQSELAEMQEVAELHKTDASFLSKMKMLTKTILVKFSELSKLRHDTAVYKIPTLIAHLKSCVSEHKVVTFCHHKDVAKALRKAFEKESVMCVGGMTPVAKNSSVYRFQNDADCMLFIGSSAAGVGLTLTAASHVVMAELDWTPAIITQKEDRCHRDGQKDSVLVQHIVLQGSIDAMMAHKMVAKQAVIDAALGDTQ